MDLYSNTSATLGNFITSDSINITRGRKGSEKLPSFVLIITLTVVGIIGNSHVLIVYIQRYNAQVKQHGNATNPFLVFVLSLAILDSFTCFVIFPMINMDLNTNFTPFSENMCKGLAYFTYLAHVSGVLHVTLISLHCYRQVCKPHAAQIHRKLAIKFCISFDIAASLIAFPITFLSRHLKDTVDGEQGLICTLGLGIRKNSLFPKIYFGLLSCSLITGLTIICVCNILLMISRCRKPKLNHQKHENNLKNTLKTSAILITIAALFVLSYLPYMTLAIVSAVIPNFQKELSEEGRAAREFFLWFPFFNNVINPFVYSLRDTEFRQRLWEMYSRLQPRNIEK